MRPACQRERTSKIREVTEDLDGSLGTSKMR
jgi:hypothetical protein